MKRFVFPALVVLPLTLSAATQTSVKTFAWSMPATTLDGSPVYVAGDLNIAPGAPIIGGTRIYCGGALVLDVLAPAITAPFPANMNSYAPDGSYTSCVAAVYEKGTNVEGLRSVPVTIANIAGKFLPGSTLAAPGSFALSLQ